MMNIEQRISNVEVKDSFFKYFIIPCSSFVIRYSKLNTFFLNLNLYLSSSIVSHLLTVCPSIIDLYNSLVSINSS